jgi:autotransporter-associated beta strand protein
MITPGIQLYDSGNLVGNFLTFSGNNLVLSTYTDFADNTWAAAGNATLVNVTAATALGSGADVNIHALRIFSGNQDLGGRTVNLGSGGLITTNANTSNGTLNFGSTAAYIGAYNASAQATISAAITASGGLTVLGTSQTLNITGTNTNLTGGIFINGGAVRLSTLGANGNNVTVGAFGRLVAGQTSTPTTDKIGGLSGVGIVSSWVANAGTSEGTLEISPATGTHTFNGSLTNGNGSPRPLAIIKSGNGTQVFGTNSVGSYTGNTTVSEGTLIINGDFSTATGNVHVASGAILGGNGTLGGTTSVTGSLRPGNSLGILTITNSFTWNSGDDWVFELGAANSSDRLILTGSNGEFLKGSGSTFEFDFAGSTTTGNFTLVDWSSTSNLGGGALGTSFQLSDFTYTGLGGGNTGTFSLSGSQLNFTVVPEPATWALLTTCLTVTMVFRKRTSRRRDG